MPAAVVDLSLNAHAPGWLESRGAAKAARGAGVTGTMGHYASVAQEAGAPTSGQKSE